MYSRILVPLDGSDLSEQILPYVQLLAKAMDLSVKLLQMVMPIDIEPAILSEIDGLPGPIRMQLATSGDIERLAASRMRKAEAYLQEKASILRDSGVSSVATQVYQGSGAEHILQEADSEPSALVAISTHGRHGITRWVLGSTTDKVIQATHNPVLVFRPKDKAAQQTEVSIDRIIVPLDGSTLAEQALPHVSITARALKAEVVLVRATPSAADLYRYVGYLYIPPPSLSLDVDAEAIQYLEGISNRLREQGVANTHHQLLHGEPAAAIADLAARDPASLVVMTSHGRSGIGRWVLGSVTDRVIRTSASPVLVVRSSNDG